MHDAPSERSEGFVMKSVVNMNIVVACVSDDFFLSLVLGSYERL